MEPPEERHESGLFAVFGLDTAASELHGVVQVESELVEIEFGLGIEAFRRTVGPVEQTVGADNAVFRQNHEVVAVVVEGIHIESGFGIFGEALAHLFVEHTVAQLKNGFALFRGRGQLENKSTAREPLLECF